MQTLTNLKTAFQKGAKDVSTDTWDDFGLPQINTGLHDIESDLGILEQEFVRQSTTAVDTTTVELPENMIRLKKIYLTVSNRRIVPDPVYDDDLWQELLIYDTAEQSDYAEKYIVRDNYIELFPEPVTANPITFIYKGTVGDLMYEDSTTGTIALTNGSTTLTGTSTAWDASFVGRYIKPSTSRYWYQIASVTSTTVAALRKKWQGATASGLSHTIGDIPYTLPESAQMLPAIYALWQYYTFIRKDTSLAKMYETQYTKGVEKTKGNFKNRVQSVVIPSQNNLRKYGVRLKRSTLARGLTD